MKEKDIWDYNIYMGLTKEELIDKVFALEKALASMALRIKRQKKK